MKTAVKLAFVLALLIAGTSMSVYAQDKDKKEKKDNDDSKFKNYTNHNSR